MITKADKVKFLLDNKELADACFAGKPPDYARMAGLIVRARVSLGYSAKTYNLDIFYSLKRQWAKERAEK